MAKSFVGIPSVYQKLLKLRKSTTAKFKENKFLKPSTVLRYYQVVGSLHMLLLERMVLSDGTGLGKCVLSSTYISTTHGLIPISELAQSDMGEDTFCNVPEDLFLLSQKGKVKPSLLYYSGIHDGFKITTHRGYEVTGLPHHPVLCGTKESITYKKVEELQIGDYVCINRKGLFSEKPFKIILSESFHYNSKEYKMPEYVDERLAELMGYYIAEGHSPKNQSLIITKHDDNRRDHIRYLLKKIFDYSETGLNKKYKSEIIVNSIRVCNCFVSLGINLNWLAGDKEVPYSIFQSPKNIIRSFLRSYFDCYGSVGKDGTVECSSKSEKLIHQIQLLLLNFGIISRRRLKMVKVKDSRRPYWILYFHGKNLVLFQKEIGFISEQNKRNLDIHRDKPKNTNVDVIPFGAKLLKESMGYIIPHLRSLPKQKGFSIKGSGWEGLVGYKYKYKLEAYIYGKRQLTYEGLKEFIETIERLNLTSVVLNYQELKEVYEKNFFFDKIVDITEIKDGKYYDFHVPEENNFTGNGFINHNTLQTIAAYTFLLQNDPSLKLLVVCPKSATFQWQEEFEKFTIGVTTRVIVDKIKRKRKGYDSRMYQYEIFNENVLIINYAPVINEYERLVEILSPNYMFVADEAVAFKNRKKKTHFACKYLQEYSQRTYGLTATIIKNDLEEVWSVYDVVVPGLFGNITNFRKNFCHIELMKLSIKGRTVRIPKVTGYKNLKKFKQVLDPYFLIRRKEDVASELPKLISKRVILEMLPRQKELYREALLGILYEERLKHEYFDLCDQIRNGLSGPKVNKRYDELKEKYEAFLSPEGKKRGKLAALIYSQMVSNGPFLINEEGESSKELEFVRLMEEELLMEKVILFTRFKSGIPALEILCERNNIKYTKIHGDIDNEGRREARLTFQNDPTSRLIIITTAGSAALNLQAASVILFYDTPWSYGDLVQIIGRGQRIGSVREHILLIHLINKNTIDERVIDKVSDKKSLSDEIVGNIAEGALDFVSHDHKVIDDLYEDLLKDAKGFQNG